MSRPAFALHDFHWPKEDREEISAELRAEIVDDLYAEYADDPDKRAEAESWIAGTFDESHYRDVTLALFDLQRTAPDKADGVIARLYALAKVDGTAMESELRRMAEQAVDCE